MPPSPLLDQAPIVLTPDGGFFYQPTLVGVMIDLAKLASWEGWTLVVDDNAPNRPDILGTPQRDELCAQACKGNVVAIRSELPLDHAFYAVAHEIAEARNNFTGHHQAVWREQCAIMSRWCRLLREDNGLLERELAAVTNALDECRKERGALCDHLLEMAV